MDIFTFGNEDDKLNLQPFAMQLTNMIENIESLKSDNSFVIAIDSSWGTGKTTFLKMWQNLINSRNSCIKAFYYNAWLNDDYEEPLLPILYTLNEEKLLKGASFAKLVKSGSILALKNTVANTRLTFGVVSIQGNSLTQTIDGIEKLYKSSKSGKENAIFDDYKKHLKNREQFMDTLSKIPILKSDKVIIMVDELDRCRPSFAIETLELIKHLFNVNNIIFVFSIDIIQLSHSIATLYGQNMDSNGYLRRFFDLIIPLPSSSIDKLIYTKLKRPASNKTSKHALECNSALINDLSKISIGTQLSLRDVEKFILYVKILFSSVLSELDQPYNEELSYVLCTYYCLIILRYKYTNLWNFLITHQKYNTETLAELNDIEKRVYDYFDSRCDLVYVQSFFNVLKFSKHKKIKDITDQLQFNNEPVNRIHFIYPSTQFIREKSFLEAISDDMSLVTLINN